MNVAGPTLHFHQGQGAGAGPAAAAMESLELASPHLHAVV